MSNSLMSSSPPIGTPTPQRPGRGTGPPNCQDKHRNAVVTDERNFMLSSQMMRVIVSPIPLQRQTKTDQGHREPSDDPNCDEVGHVVQRLHSGTARLGRSA